MLTGAVFSMVLVGLWHGAGWNFIVFGLVSGILVASYTGFRHFVFHGRPLLGTKPWATPIATILTFVGNTMLIGIFFRAPDLNTAFRFLSSPFNRAWDWNENCDPYLVLVIVLLTVHILRGLFMSRRKEIALPGPVRGIFWFGLLMSILYGTVDTSEKFIYFQF